MNLTTMRLTHTSDQFDAAVATARREREAHLANCNCKPGKRCAAWWPLDRAVWQAVQLAELATNDLAYHKTLLAGGAR